MPKKKKYNTKTVEAIRHDEATRKNIPTAEYQSVMREDEKDAIHVAYERRNRDLDPQLVWRGKDEQDWSDLVVQAPPLYIQEKVHPKVLIDDLMRQTREQEETGRPEQLDLFSDFNGLPTEGAKTEFYQHEANWSNRMILGDSLQVMASLAEREGLRGKVQCIYIDPPYGIKFNSNFQRSTTSRDVKDGNPEHITREPEQVKAKLLQMPLHFLSNTDSDWFTLDKPNNTFSLKPDLAPYWNDPFFRDLVADRVRFAMTRYFSRKAHVADIPYTQNIFKSGFTVPRDFALAFLGDHPLKPGDSRKIKLKMDGKRYHTMLQRPGRAQEYRVEYDAESDATHALREYLGDQLNPGETAFSLRAAGKAELIAERPGIRAI